ncbi:cingulin isoform 1-T1 [Ciconia maguari]
MEWPASAAMAEKQNPVDYGVQIRFINDLQEPRRPPKARGKPGSYGVAVRVQGIAGQPFVVLNSGEKGSDSFGVQIKSEGSYPNPPAGPQPSGSVSSDSDLPENPYAGRQPRHGSSYSTSDEEASGISATSRHKPKPPLGKRPLREELRRTQSHGDLLGATTVEPFATSAPQDSGSRQHRALADGKSSSMLNIAPERSKASGSRAVAKDPCSDTEAVVDAGGSDVDTKPLSSVDSLISKFDGKVQQRGRAARRGRIPSEERKRSQSLDGRVSHRDVPDARELSGAQRRASGVRPQPSVPAGSLSRPSRAGGMEDRGTRSQRLNRGVEEPTTERLQSKAQAELQLKSTPDLLRDQREVSQPGGSEHPKDLIYGILKEGSSESEISLKRKTARLLEKMQELAVPAKDAACSQPQHRELARKVEELQEKLDEETKVKPGRRSGGFGGRQIAVYVPAGGEAQWVPALSPLHLGLGAQARPSFLLVCFTPRWGLSGMLGCRRPSRPRQSWGGCWGGGRGASLRSLAALPPGGDVTPVPSPAAPPEAGADQGAGEERLRSGPGSPAAGGRRGEPASAGGPGEENPGAAEEFARAERGENGQGAGGDPAGRLRGAAAGDAPRARPPAQGLRHVPGQRSLVQGAAGDQGGAGGSPELQAAAGGAAAAAGAGADGTEGSPQGGGGQPRQGARPRPAAVPERHGPAAAQHGGHLAGSGQPGVGEAEDQRRGEEPAAGAGRERGGDGALAGHVPEEQGRAPQHQAGELRQAREAQRELAAEKQSQEELLRQRERELAALKGTMREETSSRDEELERYRRDLQQLQEERDEATKAKASLESARETSERARRTVESSLRELQEQNDDLRRKVLGMETQLKDYERLGENWEGSQARLKEKVTKLEAERRQMEESLGEATEREQELLMAKRSLETRLEEAQRSLARLTQEHQELSASYQDEQRQKEQLKRAKSELEEQKRLLDRTTEKLNKELEQMTEESHSSLAVLKSQLEEFKEKSRKEITDSQKQAKDRGAEVEKMQFSMGRLQDEVSRLKQALQDSQAERESALLDKEVLLQRLHNLEQEMETKKRSQDDRSRHIKALEEKSKHLEVELDEERTTVELLTERVNRSRDQIDQLRAELLQERSSRQDLECDKVSLERQNKELKSRLASSEGLQKPSSNVSQLEARVEELQDKLQAEEREKSILLSSNRKLERKVKELTIQIDDERQHVSDQKDQLSLRVKALKRQVDEAEEEIERLEGARKKAQRELEEQHELNEQLQNRIKALEKEAWRKAARSAADSSLQDDQLSSDEEFDSAYGPSSIASLLNEANLQTSSC